MTLKSESLSEQGPFTFHFDREGGEGDGKEGDFVITIYDSYDEEYAKVYSDDFSNALHHAMHFADPLLAAWAWPNYIEWNAIHKVT